MHFWDIGALCDVLDFLGALRPSPLLILAGAETRREEEEEEGA